jgi:Icc protein
MTPVHAACGVRAVVPGWLLGFLLVGSACLRPSEERVRQDLRVGQAETPELAVSVAAGAAVVRSLGPDAVELWASTPRLRFELGVRKVPVSGSLSIDVHNCMPDSELALDDAAIAVESLGRGPTGVCSFRLGPLNGAGERRLGLRMEPPGTAAPSAFRFAVMSDVQEAIGSVQDIYRAINREPDLDFLLGAGDLTQQGTHAQLTRFQAELEQLQIPYYTTLGNHELGETPTLYHDYFGRGNMSFDYRGMRFTLLDSASATIDPIVFDWLDEWLVLGAEQLHLVAMHVPPLDPVGVRNGAFANRNEAAKLLGRLAAGGVDVTIYGHIHSYYHFENAGIPAHVSGGGGAIPERFDDMGRHFLVIDADPVAHTLVVRVVRID